MKHKAGQLVYCDFPKSDMSETQDRTVLLVAEVFGDDVIGCLVTNHKPQFEKYVCLTSAELDIGELDVDPSYVRPVRICTLDSGIIRRSCGEVKGHIVEQVLAILREKFAPRIG